MKKVIISPFSQKLRNNEINPKNFPHWKEVVNQLKINGIHTIQIGVHGEEDIGADETFFNLKLKELEKLLKEANTWASVDNFFHHFANLNKKQGVVVFGKSNPDIFGYPQNTNLLKDKKYLRELQFDIWEREKYSNESFVNPEEVTKAIMNLL